MEEVFKKIRELRHDKEHVLLGRKHQQYYYGYADAINEVIELLNNADIAVVSKRHIIDDKDACKCKPGKRIVNPPKERNRGKIRKCGSCGKPLSTKFQE